MPGAAGGSNQTKKTTAGGLGAFIGKGKPRAGSGGVIVHAPCTVKFVARGSYVSVLPDGQKAVVDWTDGEATFDYPDGAGAGFCDSIVSANKQRLTDQDFVDWDLHDMSETDNDIGHGVSEDNLGLQPYLKRVYAILFKNWTAAEGSFGNLVIGNSATNEWTPILEPGSIITLPPDSILALVIGNDSGFPVEADNCNLRLLADGGDVVHGINYIGNSE